MEGLQDFKVHLTLLRIKLQEAFLCGFAQQTFTM